MTKEEEELLAEGKNFKHFDDSVETGCIKVALCNHYLIDSAMKQLE